MPLEISHPYLLMAGIALTPVCLLVLAVGALAQNNVEKRAQLLQSTGWDKPERQLIAGFFHPFSSGGAGGERVLWKAITQLQRDHPEVMVLLYTGDFPSGFKSKEAAYAKKDEVIKSIQVRRCCCCSTHQLTRIVHRRGLGSLLTLFASLLPAWPRETSSRTTITSALGFSGSLSPVLGSPTRA